MDSEAVLEILRLEIRRCGLLPIARRLGVAQRTLASVLLGSALPGSRLLILDKAKRAGIGQPEALTELDCSPLFDELPSFGGGRR